MSNRLEATDRMLKALTLGVEDDFHVKDVLREPDGKPGSDPARHDVLFFGLLLLLRGRYYN